MTTTREAALEAALKAVMSDLFYQLEAKRGAQFASEYPSYRQAINALATPAADTRVVTVLELNHLANTAAECGLSVMAKTIRTIIGTATAAPSDKIAEAARLKAISLALAKITGRDAADEAALDSLAAEIRSLRALAGQGETP